VIVHVMVEVGKTWNTEV